jgi:hypothetical protein
VSKSRFWEKEIEQRKQQGTASAATAAALTITISISIRPVASTNFEQR